MLSKTTQLVASVMLVAALSFAGAGTAQSQSVTVSTASQLQDAVSAANAAGGNTTITLRSGVYAVAALLNITAPHVTLQGETSDRTAVTIQGDAMSADAKVQGLIRVTGSYFTIRNLTLRLAGTHLLQIAGEFNADNPVIQNVIFRDAYQQLLKVSIDTTNLAVGSDNGLVEDSLFEYTAGIGPEYYIGGIDAHGGTGWIVRRNVFRSIISPSDSVAEFAVHFWDQSSNALVEQNVFVNNDRSIGFGLGTRGNSGGIIRNNMIYHASGNGAFADTSIYLETSPNTQIYNNSIYMEDTYPNAIEYRGTPTTGVLVANNLTNKPIKARDGATGTGGSNVGNAVASWFVAPSSGNLHLAYAVPSVVGAGQTIAGLTDDFDSNPRPTNGIDIGADQRAVQPNPPTSLRAQ